MQNPLSRYAMLAKRWAWVVLLGVIICSGSTYIVTKLMKPVYDGQATLILSTGNPADETAILQAAPGYASLVTSPQVLTPVAQKHGLTYKQLSAMVTAKAQPNTQIITIDVENGDPVLAATIATDIGQYFSQYISTQASTGTLQFQVIPASVPTDAIRPKPSLDAEIGALVGLGLSIALVVIFEWLDDRPTSPEQTQDTLDMNMLTVVPNLSRKERVKNAEEIPALAEGCRILCASLNAAQTAKPFKTVMFTSSLAAEGKSTIAVNVATFLAMSGKDVLLVDGNLRSPALDQHFQLDNRRGFASAFLDMWSQIEVDLNGQATEIPTLRVLTAGALPANPAELLQSPLTIQIFEYFKKSPFDYIIFDTPPLLPVADTQILAAHVERTVLIVDASKTSRAVLQRAKRTLARTSTKVLGFALNKSQWAENGEIRQYQSIVRTPKTFVDMSTPMARPPQTPPLDNVIRQNTVSTGYPQRNGNPER